MRWPDILSRRKLRARRPFKLTAAGWVFILYTIGVGAGAINTGNNLLYLIFGVFLGLIMASGALSDMSLWGLEAECFWPRSSRAGAAAMIPVRVRNEKRFLPSLCVTLELEAEIRGAAVVMRAYVPFIAPGGSATVHLTWTPEERGWLQLRALRFQTRYPFGLLKKRWTSVEMPAFAGAVDRAAGLFVFPAPFVVPRDARPPAADGANALAPDNRRGEGDNMYGLREYRDTDNPRRIHWKASAKRGGTSARGWVVRETERDQDSEILLAMDVAEIGRLSDAERDAVVRYAAGLGDAYAAEGHRVRLQIKSGGKASSVVAIDESAEAEWEFLSLWDPSAPGLGGAERYLRPEAADARRSIDLYGAYRRWSGARR